MQRLDVGGFLQSNPLAKIVIVLDTHSVQDGQLSYHETDSQYTDWLGNVCSQTVSLASTKIP